MIITMKNRLFLHHSKVSSSILLYNLFYVEDFIDDKFHISILFLSKSISNSINWVFYLFETLNIWFNDWCLVLRKFSIRLFLKLLFQPNNLLFLLPINLSESINFFLWSFKIFFCNTVSNFTFKFNSICITGPYRWMLLQIIHHLRFFRDRNVVLH